MNEFVEWIKSHASPDVDNDCEWGEHWDCWQCRQDDATIGFHGFYSFSEWLDYHVAKFEASK